MVKGETFDLQLFESEAFRHFINVFTNKQSGVTQGCNVTQNAQNITVSPGYFFIQGGLLREETGTDNEIPSGAGYYKLVYEIDLSKTNQKDIFNQGSYKFIRSTGGYPSLTQEDLDNGGTVYQLPFCQFRVTEQGLQDFVDIRPLVNYGIYLTKEDGEDFVNKSDRGSITVWNSTNQGIFQGTGFVFRFNNSDSSGDFFEIQNSAGIKVLKDCRVHISSKIFVEKTSGAGYVLSNILVNGNSISTSLEKMEQDFTDCVDPGTTYDLKANDIITLTVDYTSSSGNPEIRAGRKNSSISIFVI